MAQRQRQRDAATSQGMLGAMGSQTKARKESLLEPWRKHDLAETSILHFWLPELQDNTVAFF